MASQYQRQVSEALRVVVEDNGRRVAGSPAKVRAMLSDALGSQARDARAEMEVVATAAELGLGEGLLAGSLSPIEATKRLVEVGISTDMARFACAAWSIAGGHTTALDPTGMNPPGPEPTGTETRLAEPVAPAGSSGTATTRARRADPSPPIDPPEPLADEKVANTRRGIGRLVLASVLATAVLVSLFWFFATRQNSTSTTAAHSGHSSGSPSSSSSGTTESTKPMAPMNMPSKTPVKPTVLTVPTDVVAPDAGSGGSATAVKVTATGNATQSLTAKGGDKAFTPLISSNGGPCSENAGGANLAWCGQMLDVGAGGTIKNFEIVNVSLVEQHGKVKIVGTKLEYIPYHNGKFEEHITFQLQGAGLVSKPATFVLHANCNQNYECH